MENLHQSGKQSTLFPGHLQVVKRPHFVYLFLTEDHVRAQVCKIGMTEKSQLTNRLNKVCCSSGYDCSVYHLVPCESWGQASAVEMALHNRFARQRRRGEWFDLSGKDIALIAKIESAKHMLELCNDGEFYPIHLAA